MAHLSHWHSCHRWFFLPTCFFFGSEQRELTYLGTGTIRLPHLCRWHAEHQGDFTCDPHDFCRRARCDPDLYGRVVLRRHHHLVRTIESRIHRILLIKDNRGRAMGIGFILGGSIWYTWAKSQESKPASEPAVQLPQQHSQQAALSPVPGRSRGGSPSVSYAQGDSPYESPQHRRGSTIAFGEKMSYSGSNLSASMSRASSQQTYVEMPNEAEKDQLT